MEHPSLTLLTKRYSQGTPREEGSAIFALTGWSITGFLSKLFTRYHIWPALLTIASTARHSHAGNYSKSHTQKTLRQNKSSEIVLHNTKSYCIIHHVRVVLHNLPYGKTYKKNWFLYEKLCTKTFWNSGKSNLEVAFRFYKWCDICYLLTERSAPRQHIYARLS